jgi:transcriptional regulator GlxA family with amidase domain
MSIRSFAIFQEARSRLLATNEYAAKVSFEVGYQSASQFSREYRRLFGAPPRRDANRLRSRGLARNSHRVYPLLAPYL